MAVILCFHQIINPFEDSEITARSLRGPARSSEAGGRTFSLEVACSRSRINFRRPPRHFERACSLEVAVFAAKRARPRLSGTSRAPNACFFDMSRCLAACAPKRVRNRLSKVPRPLFRSLAPRLRIRSATCSQHVRHRKTMVKNHCFYYVPAMSEFPRDHAETIRNDPCNACRAF